jgi:1,2-diacylglycerol 3-alpha-glucosyltransferase
MKIGFFTDSYLPRLDGVSVSVETCVRALRERGHEVYVIAPRYPRYKDKGNDIYRLASVKFPASPGTPEIRWGLQLPEKTLLKIIRMNFDIIHGHSGGGVLFLGLQVARAKNIPFVITYHTLFNRYTHYFFNGKIITPKMLELASKFIGNMCDFLIAPTDRVKKELIDYGVKKPIEIVASGIELDNYKNVTKGFLREKVSIPNNHKILLYVGRLGKEKSVNFIIRSFKLIHEKNPQITLVLVGDGSEKVYLKELAKELGVSKNVIFFGSVKHADIPKVYADADVFVFASQTETQGMVILEALASGVPVVAVNDEAFQNVITIGKNGYLIKQDIRLFAEKTLDLLSNDILYKQFSQNAVKTVEKFSVQNTALYLEELYEKVIKEKNATGKRATIPTPTIQSVMDFFVKANYRLRKYYE